MEIQGIIWLEVVVDKLSVKHSVSPEEVEEALSVSRFRFLQAGTRKGEDVYIGLGRSDAGRYLAVVFIRKVDRKALILSARDMTPTERRAYERK